MTRPRRRRTAARIYQKGQDRAGRAFFYGDFRAYRAVGGRLEALKAPGDRRATTSVEAAEANFASRLRELKRLATDGGPMPTPRPVGPLRLVEAFRQHLEKRAESGKYTVGTLMNDEKAATNLFLILGDIPLRDIDGEVLAMYVAERRARGHRQTGGPISDCTLRNELHSLSSLLKRAVFEKAIPEPHPMKGWTDLPDAPPSRRRYLSREEGRALLRGAEAEDARIAALRASGGADLPLSSRGRGGAPVPFTHTAHTQAAALVATLLYTGGRSQEVTGLLVEDVDFAEGVIRIRPNRFRRLKRSWAERSVPLPAPLARRLAAHIAARGLTGQDALFPNGSGGALATVNGLLRRCARLGKMSIERLSAHCLRHTFATIMLRTTTTTTNGTQVLHTPFEVAKMLGHRSSELVETVYAHWHPTLPIEAALDFEPRAQCAEVPKRKSRQSPSDVGARVATERRTEGRGIPHIVTNRAAGPESLSTRVSSGGAT